MVGRKIAYQLGQLGAELSPESPGSTVQDRGSANDFSPSCPLCLSAVHVEGGGRTNHKLGGIASCSRSLNSTPSALSMRNASAECEMTGVFHEVGEPRK